MGGYGSGRRGWASPKSTVEDCIVLAASKLQRDRLIAAGLDAWGSLVWRRVSTGEQTSSIGYHVNTLAGGPATIRLDYTTKRRGESQVERMEYPVSLTTTPLPWAGVRWWFICPLTVNGQTCGRRVGKLYLPPGGKYFGCRHCYNLTYESTRESHMADQLARFCGGPVERWRGYTRMMREERRLEERWRRRRRRQRQVSP